MNKYLKFALVLALGLALGALLMRGCGSTKVTQCPYVPPEVVIKEVEVEVTKKVPFEIIKEVPVEVKVPVEIEVPVYKYLTIEKDKKVYNRHQITIFGGIGQYGFTSDVSPAVIKITEDFSAVGGIGYSYLVWKHLRIGAMAFTNKTYGLNFSFEF